MKKYITMQKCTKYNIYSGSEIVNAKFFTITQLFSPYIRKGELIHWFHDENRTIEGNEWFEIRKEPDMIALYDRSDRMSDETIFNLDPLI